MCSATRCARSTGQNQTLSTMRSPRAIWPILPSSDLYRTRFGVAQPSSVSRPAFRRFWMESKDGSFSRLKTLDEAALAKATAQAEGELELDPTRADRVAQALFGGTKAVGDGLLV